MLHSEAATQITNSFTVFDYFSWKMLQFSPNIVILEEQSFACAILLFEVNSVCTWLDGCDTSSCWVPGCMKTKVSAAVGLLVQANPHVTEVFLKTTRWVEINSLIQKRDTLQLQQGINTSGCIPALTGTPWSYRLWMLNKWHLHFGLCRRTQFLRLNIIFKNSLIVSQSI